MGRVYFLGNTTGTTLRSVPAAYPRRYIFYGRKA